MKYIFGIAVCFVLAMFAHIGASYIGGPYMLYALVMGVLVQRLCFKPPYKAGIEFSAKMLLCIGVALLGTRITFTEMSSLGMAVVWATAGAVIATLVFGVLMGCLLGVGMRMGVLTGGSTAICGASAAMAIASVFPEDKKLAQQTLFTVVGVNVLSTIAMVVYPLIAIALDYNALQSGVFLGASIHDVAQVVGAGFSMSTDVGNIATITKLLRVAMLLPVVFTLGALVYWLWRQAHKNKHCSHVKAPFPWFLIGFLAVVGLNSFGLLSFQLMPPLNMPVSAMLATISKWLLTMAVVALGMKTSFGGIVSVGGRAMVLLILEMIFIAVLSLWIASYVIGG